MNVSKFSVSKRKIVAVVVGAAAFAAVTVSAATLGGVATDNVGANSNVVASSIKSGVKLSWTTAYQPTAKAYEVTGITLTPIVSTEKIPNGAKVNVTLSTSAGVSLGEYTSTAGADGALTFTKPTSTVTAHSVAFASVVINGGAVTTVVDGTN